METKTCKTCGKNLSLDDFYLEYSKRDKKYRYRNACKNCERKRATAWRRENRELSLKVQRASNLKRYFGITITEYDQMLEQQHDGCAVCGGQNVGGRRLAVDHDHKTGQVRGLLCHHCNAAIGHVEEDISRLLGLIAYVEKHRKN